MCDEAKLDDIKLKYNMPPFIGFCDYLHDNFVGTQPFKPIITHSKELSEHMNSARQKNELSFLRPRTGPHSCHRSQPAMKGLFKLNRRHYLVNSKVSLTSLHVYAMAPNTTMSDAPSAASCDSSFVPD